MRLKILKLFILSIIIVNNVSAELQGPPLESTETESHDDDHKTEKKHTLSNERKSAKLLDADDNDDDNDVVDDDDDDDDKSKTITSLLDSFIDDLNIHGSAIKIIQAPDLVKEQEARQVSEVVNEIMENHRKWMDKLETEIEGIDNTLQAIQEADEETKPLTPAEIELENAYEAAIKNLNPKRDGKYDGYNALMEVSLKGHPKAQAHIAWAQLMGGSLDMDIEKAKETFIRLSENGVPLAQMGLGFMYAAGIGFNVSQSRALVYYTMAAIGDEPWAQMALGYRYWAGITVAHSCEKALDFYRNVAKKVASQVTFSGGTGVHRIRLLDEIEHNGLTSGVLDNDLIEYYQLLAEKGDVQAQVGLGQLHFQGGRGIQLDHLKALQYFTKAANAGNAIAMAFLGKLYLEGSEFIKANNDTAFEYFSKAAKLGNPIGQSGLGLMYLQGRAVSRDTVKALDYFTLAADQGWVDGQLQLGNMYFSGIGVQRDFKLANKYFNLASQAGHVLAYYNLGQMHAVGLGMMRSCPTAVELFKNVAERGKWSELLMYGHTSYKLYNFNSAFMHYAIGAELGYEVAQSNAGFILDRSEQTLINDRHEELVRALQYWRRASTQGYSAAQVKLGDYHYYGLGTNVDYDAAASHYRFASDQQHNAQAMFNLGYMHEQGLGMKKDWHLAKRCYDLAAETNVDAKVPVALALLKLSMKFKLKAFNESPFSIIWELDNNIASNWDLYLIAILTIVLGMIFYLRNPGNIEQPQGQAEQQRPEPQAQQPNPQTEPPMQPQQPVQAQSSQSVNSSSTNNATRQEQANNENVPQHGTNN